MSDSGSNNSPSDPDASTFLRRCVYGVVAGILVYAGFAFVGDFGEVTDHLGRVPLWVVAGACGLSAVNYLLRFAKWHLYLRLLELKVDPLHSLVVFLAGLTMSISPGKVGEVIKSVLLKRSRGLSVARTAPVVFAERLTDLLGLFVLAAVGIVVFRYGIVGFASALAATVGLVLVVQSPSLVDKLLDLVERLPVVGRFRPSLDRAYRSTRRLLRWRPLVATTILSAMAWSMEVVAFAWILDHLGAPSPVWFESFFVYSTSTLLGALSFLPGGLGVTEGSLTGLLMWLEMFDDINLALAATYLIRLTTLWFGVVVGLIFFLLYELSQRTDDPESSPPDEGDDSRE